MTDVGGEVNVYRPEAYCINVCTSLYADKMAEGSVNDRQIIRGTTYVCTFFLPQRESSDSNYALIRHFIKNKLKIKNTPFS